MKETWDDDGARRSPRDWTLYMGALGTAFLLLKSYLITNNAEDPSLCADTTVLLLDPRTYKLLLPPPSFLSNIRSVCVLINWGIFEMQRGDFHMLEGWCVRSWCSGSKVLRG